MQQPAPRIWQLPEDLQIKENLPKEIMWMEAYNEKCRECQRLRFDLEEEQSKVQLLKVDLKIVCLNYFSYNSNYLILL